MKLFVIAAGLFVVVGFISFKVILGTDKQSSFNAPSPTSSTQTETADFTASFQIITNEIVRNFANSKYHQRSQSAFLLPNDPSVVHVKKVGVTWGEFFATLPMELTKECLKTGDGEVFCSNQNETLRFYVNSKEDPSLLDREINDGDKVLIEI